jgi:hypothetical protein
MVMQRGEPQSKKSAFRACAGALEWGHSTQPPNVCNGSVADTALMSALGGKRTLGLGQQKTLAGIIN